MQSAKQQIEAMLGQLPDDCTFEDVEYHLRVLKKISKAEDSIVREGALPHEEAKRRMARWLLGF